MSGLQLRLRHAQRLAGDLLAIELFGIVQHGVEAALAHVAADAFLLAC